MSSCTKIPDSADYKYIHPKCRQAYAEGKHWGHWKVGDQLIAVCRGDFSIKRCFIITSIERLDTGTGHTESGTCLLERSRTMPLGNINGTEFPGIPKDEYEKYWFYVQPKEESFCCDGIAAGTMTFTSGVGTMRFGDPPTISPCSEPERIEYEISPKGKNIRVTITKQPESITRDHNFKLSNGWDVRSVGAPALETSIETLYLIGNSGDRDFYPMSPKRYALFVEIVELFNKEYPKRNEKKAGDILNKIQGTFRRFFVSEEKRLKEIESIICKAKGENS